MAKNKVVYAKKSVLDANEFDTAHVKVAISIRLSGAVLAAVKLEAAKTGVKYQSLINQILNDRYFGKLEENRIRTLIREELGKVVRKRAA